jgi:hypothetical protein
MLQTPWGNGAADADYSADGKKLVFEAHVCAAERHASRRTAA